MFLGAGLLASGVVRTLDSIHMGVGLYDEGILLTNSWLVGLGRLPYKDFYTNYPPGIYHLIRAWWLAFGMSVTSERLLGAALHLAVAGLGGRIGGRIAGRRFSLFTAGLVLVWLAGLSAFPFAWLAALCAALAWIELSCIAVSRSGPAMWAASGFAIGAVGALRHDLFVFLLATLSVVGLARLALVRRIPQRREILPAGCVVVGALVPLVVVYGPIVIGGQLEAMINDLYFYQVHYVAPHRHLPFPPLLSLVSASRTPFRLPALIADPFGGAVGLTLIGPEVALLARWRSWSRDRVALVLIATLAVAVVPQMLDRTDLTHALYTVTPGLIIVAGLLEALPPARAGTAAISSVVLACVLFPVRNEGITPASIRQIAVPSLQGRASGLLAADQRAMIAFVDQHVLPTQRTFSATTDNIHISTNDVSMYYLAEREGVTSYMQFDPGLTTRADVQSKIIAGLERWRPPVIVLLSSAVGIGGEKPSAGSHLLDDYFRRAYVPYRRFGVFYVELRR